ncbi:transposase [Massilia endophytica]|uniref:transposase n=1 Tax=Massilia endophytica TaxID=2899220 RepID=UPI001E4E1C00|nr:transposase [Massilia endophytica]UGQ45198.1 transposase [Massilia endophytica]
MIMEIVTLEVRMPRRARLLLPGMPLHIVQRGHNRQQCFFNQTDYLFFLSLLQDFAGRLNCPIHAYVLMTNHVHVLASFSELTDIACVMKGVAQEYAQYINRRAGRTGALWEGRYRSCPVPTERYVMACQRYIELNPVRAGMVDSPELYRWSSYNGNAGFREDPLLTPHFLYEGLAPDPGERHECYRQLFRRPLTVKQLEELRGSINCGHVPGASGGKRGRRWNN